MKQSRRKELKTNELSLYLQELRDVVTRYSNYIIGGIVVVVLILMVGLYVQRNRYETEAARWREYREIQQAMLEGKTDVADRAAALADATAGDSRLGPLAKELHARLLYSRAMTISPLAGSSERGDLLEKAKAAYTNLLNASSNRPDLAARARLALADVQETLYVAGKGDLDSIKADYAKVVDSKIAPYADMAKERLDTLPERVKKLEIVATRPAEPTATAPAAARPSTAPAGLKLEPTVPAAKAPASAPAVK